jgi:DnaJ-class molecular chaperone
MAARTGDGAMTPYATLLVKPTDGDEVVRKAYHRIAETNHPDANGGAAGPLWYSVTAAYTAIKTHDARAEWALRQSNLAGLCERCEGFGVTGTRMFKGKIKACDVCKGEGRL